MVQEGLEDLVVQEILTQEEIRRILVQEDQEDPGGPGGVPFGGLGFAGDPSSDISVNPGGDFGSPFAGPGGPLGIPGADLGIWV